ncbi:MAG: AAC(3) family N-acetyltransferase [Chloroflexota bacterium]|nr:AAC(3) family N-acetyltransferase [Chloroflexota bacterium]
MPEKDLIRSEGLPLTIDSMAEQLSTIGLSAGQTVLVHTRMSALGWVAGGAAAVIHALRRVLTPTGTLMMPAFSPDNTDPANWVNPPVPEHWWQIIRDHTPTYDPQTTPTWGVGAVPELFRTFPDVIRSAHPEASFAACGPQAEHLLANHTKLDFIFDDDSPIGKLYALDGYVLLLGIDHSKNTSLHLAEYRAHFPKRYKHEGVAMLVDGMRQWVEYEMQDIDDGDFAQIGADYEAAHPVARGQVGRSEVRLLRQRPLVDFAVKWMEQHRV